MSARPITQEEIVEANSPVFMCAYCWDFQPIDAAEITVLYESKRLLICKQCAREFE